MFHGGRIPGLFKLAAAAVSATLVVGGVSAAAHPDPVTRASGEPTNLGRVKLDVEVYYGDSIDNKHHHHSDTSQWATDTAKRVAEAKKYLESDLTNKVSNPALVLDIDDTAEITYDWQADNDFGFDRDKEKVAIENGTFTAIKPTLELAQWAAQRGVKVYFITGRQDKLAAATLKNLTKEGYPNPDQDHVFFKPTTNPPTYLPCKVTCHTDQFKTLTRGHIIKDLRETIVVNLGDQSSDLEGCAKNHIKLPNPMYYLEGHDLTPDPCQS